MVLLPVLVFGAEVKGARVLQVWGEDDGFVPSLSRKLNAQIPRVQRDKCKLKVLGKEFLGELVEAGDCVAEGACGADVLPGEGCEGSCKLEGRESATSPPTSTDRERCLELKGEQWK